MIIMVTGAAGFIGSSLTDYLLGMGNAVVGVDNFHPHYDIKVKKQNLAKAFSNKNFRLYETSFADEDRILEILKKENIDTVIHLGAEVGSRKSSFNPLPYFDVNIGGTQILLDNCAKAKVSHVVFASTSTVYTDSISEAFDEATSILEPSTPYGISKLTNELMCRAYFRKYESPMTILRIFSTYGPRQRPDLAIHRFAQKISEQKSIELFAPKGSLRDYLYIDDCVRGIGAALNRPSGLRLYNIASGKGHTVDQVLNLLQDLIKRKVILKQAGHSSLEPRGGVASIEKARAELNYQPQIGLEQGVDRFYRWYLDA